MSAGLRVGATLLLLLGGLSLAAPWLTGADASRPIPYEPNRPDLRSTLEGPSAAHWLGTDGLGRDVAARLLHGGRVSLAVGVLSAGIALAIGIPLGIAAGAGPGWLDATVGRISEAVLALPTLLLALALIAIAEVHLQRLDDTLRVALVLGLSGWVPVSRYVRGEFLRLRRGSLAAAATAAGCPRARVLWIHLLPNALAPVWVTAAFGVAGAITAESALSFLGLGVQPPTPTWGSLLADGRAHVDQAWWLIVAPGAAMFAAILACSLVGEGLRDRFDPRSAAP